MTLYKIHEDIFDDKGDYYEIKPSNVILSKGLKIFSYLFPVILLAAVAIIGFINRTVEYNLIVSIMVMVISFITILVFLIAFPLIVKAICLIHFELKGGGK